MNKLKIKENGRNKPTGKANLTRQRKTLEEIIVRLLRCDIDT